MEAHLLQPFHVHAIHHVPQGGAHRRHHRGQHGLRSLGALRLGGGPEADLRGLGIGGQGGIFHAAHGLVEQLVHGGLPDAEGHDVPGDDDLPGEAAEVGLRAAAEHGLHLVGRAGQHQHVNAAGVEGAARGGAHRVVEDHAALRQLRLLGVVLRHGHVEGGLVKHPDVLQDVGVEHQLFSK